MVFNIHTMRHANDNEPDSMTPIGLQALAILNRLQNRIFLERMNDREQCADRDSNTDNARNDREQHAVVAEVRNRAG